MSSINADKNSLRKRKQVKFDITVKEINNDNSNSKNAITTNRKRNYILLMKYIIGLGLIYYVITRYSTYLKILHENNLWFSNIKEVEREISFRTESGLYYSYYKQLTLKSKFTDGLQELIKNNDTECWRTINIIQRFNIFQEIIIAFVYKLFNLASIYPRIYFYIDTIFLLHGIYLGTLFATTWLASNSLSSSILCVLFFIANRDNATRVQHTLPLRESFALPFIYIQIFLICVYLKYENKNSKLKENALKFLIFLSTLMFSLFWQFSQFVIMLQSFSIYSIYLISIIDYKTAKSLLISNSLALLSTYILQFGNNLILGSFGLHFTWISIVFISLEHKFDLRKKLTSKSLIYDLVYSITNGIFLLIITFLIGILTKSLFDIKDDNHIYKFVLNKLNLIESQNDFETRLYLCHGGFEYMNWSTIENLTYKTYLFPIYIASLICFGYLLIFKWINKIKNDLDSTDKHLSFLTVQSLFFFLLAITTLRMQYLWVPSICVLASSLLNYSNIYKCIFKNEHTILSIRFFVSLTIIYLIYRQRWIELTLELEDLREFYDPDTVELMNWINTNTHKDASFSGSMQLLAGVKCCTSRRLTNHPHFEDDTLREVTKQLYQVYAQQPPDYVYKILKKYKTDYIILEDSICMMNPKPNYCSLKELLDIDNKHFILPNDNLTKLVKPKAKRFCNEIRFNSSAYTKYFKSVFENHTFRVYKLN